MYSQDKCIYCTVGARPTCPGWIGNTNSNCDLRVSRNVVPVLQTRKFNASLGKEVKFQKIYFIRVVVVLLIMINISDARDTPTIFEMLGVENRWKRISKGDTCWVLTEDKTGASELTRTTVGIDTFTNYNPFDGWYFLDYIYTFNEIDTTGRRIMIFTGMNNLKTGAIESAPVRCLEANDTLHLQLYSSSSYILATSASEISGHDRSYVDYHLFLTDINVQPNKTQEIEFLYSPFNGHIDDNNQIIANIPMILWAGDLDQDQKIDFILLDAQDTDEQCYVLYLSSVAGDSSIVEKAGIIEYPGGE